MKGREKMSEYLTDRMSEVMVAKTADKMSEVWSVKTSNIGCEQSCPFITR